MIGAPAAVVGLVPAAAAAVAEPGRGKSEEYPTRHGELKREAQLVKVLRYDGFFGRRRRMMSGTLSHATSLTTRFAWYCLLKTTHSTLVDFATRLFSIVRQALARVSHIAFVGRP